eukprot:CAMPEP_0178464416 /NCGR_PEP_ID=MMETSP0689_2-20121128/50831_1 /TAXON_ID=160604 /ORGANISM="Amphidinium massartii, Strain CS-259" /LENGTH=155 /DNA_ID=CAMNT_0020091317 /DNA_START=173 /DNA_END=640 /DNA_ORIENTATION=+
MNHRLSHKKNKLMRRGGSTRKRRGHERHSWLHKSFPHLIGEVLRAESLAKPVQLRLDGLSTSRFHNLPQLLPGSSSILEIHKEGVLTIFDKLEVALCRLDRHWHSRAPRLYHYIAERLEVAGRNKDVARCVCSAELFRLQHLPQRQDILATGLLY